jgi:predicted nucleotidyltransferase
VDQDSVIKNLRKAMPELVVRFGVLHLGLFGSFARGEANPESDVDLLVTFQGEPTFAAYMGLKEDLEARLGRQVDLLTPDGLKPRIRERVLKGLLHVA